MPIARMNALMAVKGTTLYLFGGLVEQGSKEYTLNDLYCINTTKMEKWDTLISNPAEFEWLGHESDDNDDEEGDDINEKSNKHATKEAAENVKGKEKTEDTDEDDESDDDEDDEDEEVPPKSTPKDLKPAIKNNPDIQQFNNSDGNNTTTDNKSTTSPTTIGEQISSKQL